ncbi:MAG TPA: hypothetical protein VKT75_17115 [Acidobacteriaceae bacterium]|nr:hypothetical protein [Acidobacteriaceae bacterium]
MSRETYRKAEALRRKAVIMAATCAALGGIPAVTMTHGHRWIGFTAIAIQIVLLVIAVRFYRRSMMLAAGK